jgi:hypothetical protein
MIGVRFSTGGERHFSPLRQEWRWGPQPRPLNNRYRDSFLGGKAAGAWNWRLNSINCRDKGCLQIYIYSNLHYISMSWCWIRLKDIFTFRVCLNYCRIFEWDLCDSGLNSPISYYFSPVLFLNASVKLKAEVTCDEIFVLWRNASNLIEIQDTRRHITRKG